MWLNERGQLRLEHPPGDAGWDANIRIYEQNDANRQTGYFLEIQRKSTGKILAGIDGNANLKGINLTGALGLAQAATLPVAVPDGTILVRYY